MAVTCAFTVFSGEAQAVGNLLVRGRLGHQPQHIHLALGQLAGACR